MTDTAPTARARAREAVHASILAAARVRLTDEGPSQLSLRAVARDVGMVSSAVYRYFPSRDDLLTALLIADYDELGAAVEAADAAAGPAPGARWVAVCRAIRTWSIAHPGDFALLFGSPVPGYAAPRSTVEPASRTTLTIVRVVADAVADPGYRAPDAPRSGPGRLTPAVADGVESLRAFGRGYRKRSSPARSWPGRRCSARCRSSCSALRRVGLRRRGLLRRGRRPAGRGARDRRRVRLSAVRPTPVDGCGLSPDRGAGLAGGCSLR